MKPTMQQLEKWTPAELIAAMRVEGWNPAPACGVWMHGKTGYTVNLNQVTNGRETWHQYAEANVTPSPF